MPRIEVDIPAEEWTRFREESKRDGERSISAWLVLLARKEIQRRDKVARKQEEALQLPMISATYGHQPTFRPGGLACLACGVALDTRNAAETWCEKAEPPK